MTRTVYKGGSKRAPFEPRFYDQIFYSPDGCWYWLGCVTKNRPMINVDGKWGLVTRVLYQRLHKCTLDRWTFVCHHCDNPLCVNPDHLYAGTPQQNMDDMVKRGRQQQNKGVRNVRAKLTENDVNQIRARYTFGKGVRELADEFNISIAHLYCIVTKRRWKHI